MTYTFRTTNGSLVTVEADSEAEARSKAMYQHYGPPIPLLNPGPKGYSIIGLGGYVGKGLMLQ